MSFSNQKNQENTSIKANSTCKMLNIYLIFFLTIVKLKTYANNIPKWYSLSFALILNSKVTLILVYCRILLLYFTWIFLLVDLNFNCYFSGCNITSVASPSGSTLNVVWSTYTGASVYLLDLRDVNSTTISPVVVVQSAPTTQALVQGLRPGRVYQVTLKVLQFYTVVCTYVRTATTGKDTI